MPKIAQKMLKIEKGNFLLIAQLFKYSYLIIPSPFLHIPRFLY